VRFRFSAPRVWNSLSVSIRETNFTSHFQTSSKVILFSVGGPSPFGCPSCLEYLRLRALILLKNLALYKPSTYLLTYLLTVLLNSRNRVCSTVLTVTALFSVFTIDRSRHLRLIRKYVRPPNTQIKMYAGRVACCPLASHVECAPRAILRLEKYGTDEGTDGRTDARWKYYVFCWTRPAASVR